MKGAWIIGAATVFATLVIIAWRGRHSSKSASHEGAEAAWTGGGGCTDSGHHHHSGDGSHSDCGSGGDCGGGGDGGGSGS